jgi:hypothetical protein
MGERPVKGAFRERVWVRLCLPTFLGREEETSWSLRTRAGVLGKF